MIRKPGYCAMTVLHEDGNSIATPSPFNQPAFPVLSLSYSSFPTLICPSLSTQFHFTCMSDTTLMSVVRTQSRCSVKVTTHACPSGTTCAVLSSKPTYSLSLGFNFILFFPYFLLNPFPLSLLALQRLEFYLSNSNDWTLESMEVSVFKSLLKNALLNECRPCGVVWSRRSKFSSRALRVSTTLLTFSANSHALPISPCSSRRKRLGWTYTSLCCLDYALPLSILDRHMSIPIRHSYIEIWDEIGCS